MQLHSFSQCRQSDRSIEYEWDIETLADDSTRKAVLHIRHRKAGINHFSGTRELEDTFTVSVRNQSVSHNRGYSCVSFSLFRGVALPSYPAGNRFSTKKLEAAAVEALRDFYTLIEADDERLTPYFTPTTEAVAAWQATMTR